MRSESAKSKTLRSAFVWTRLVGALVPYVVYTYQVNHS